VVRYWKETDKPMLLPDAVRAVLADKKYWKNRDQIDDNRINGARRAAALRDYITAVRADILTERTREKKQKLKEAQEKMRLKMIQLKEAKIRALTEEESKDK
jgi:hypothetical protein